MTCSVAYKPRSVEVTATHLQPIKQRRQVFKTTGNYMAHALLLLKPTIDLQQLGIVQYLTLMLRQVAPYQHVNHAKLIFKGYEHHTAGGLRALPTDNQPSHRYRTPMLHIGKVASATTTALCQLGAQ